jgi:hypothetical protein
MKRTFYIIYFRSSGGKEPYRTEVQRYSDGPLTANGGKTKRKTYWEGETEVC